MDTIDFIILLNHFDCMLVWHTLPRIIWDGSSKLGMAGEIMGFNISNKHLNN